MLTEGVYKISWTEPTGTDVALDFLPNEDVISEAPYAGMPDDIRAGRYFDANYQRINGPH